MKEPIVYVEEVFENALDIRYWLTKNFKPKLGSFPVFSFTVTQTFLRSIDTPSQFIGKFGEDWKLAYDRIQNEPIKYVHKDNYYITFTPRVSSEIEED